MAATISAASSWSYNIRSQSVQAQSTPAASGGGKDRITITIQPESPSGKPCAAPMKKP